MATFLADEWLELVADKGRDLPPHDGADMVVQHEITKLPDGGKARFVTTWADGRVVTCEAGKTADADTRIEVAYDDALALLAGELRASVAYMQGRLKVDGNYERLVFGLRDWLDSDAHRAFWHEVGEATEG